jgi:hypothetical protein
MSKEQKTLATMKNLENQVRLFLYGNSYMCEKKNNFVPVFNLLSNVTPIQYLFKEFLITTNDVEREEELTVLIGGTDLIVKWSD